MVHVWVYISRHESDGLLRLSQNSNSENPNCTAIEGVLEAYFQSLRTVQLYGPTNFAPVINQVARWEMHHTWHNGHKQAGALSIKLLLQLLTVIQEMQSHVKMDFWPDMGHIYLNPAPWSRSNNGDSSASDFLCFLVDCSHLTFCATCATFGRRGKMNVHLKRQSNNVRGFCQIC